MTSKQKLSQIKSFAKAKIKELIEALPPDIYKLFDWSTAELHMQNYSYGNEGMNLISVFLTEDAKFDEQQLQDELEQISRSNHLGLYATVDEGMWQIYFFNKALNNHIKTFHLMNYDDDNFVRSCMKRLPHMESKLLHDNIEMLKELKLTSDDVFIQLTNDLTDEFGGFEDYVTLEGILKRVNDKAIVLESVTEAKYETVVKVSENWKICDIDHWQRKYGDISIEL